MSVQRGCTFARRAVAFQLAVRAGVALRAEVFLLAVRTSFVPHHSRSVGARLFQRIRLLKLRVPRCAPLVPQSASVVAFEVTFSMIPRQIFKKSKRAGRVRCVAIEPSLNAYCLPTSTPRPTAPPPSCSARPTRRHVCGDKVSGVFDSRFQTRGPSSPRARRRCFRNRKVSVFRATCIT